MLTNQALFKINFFFCLIININLILNINGIHQPSPYHTELNKVVNPVLPVHFFQGNHNTKMQTSSSLWR